MQQHSNRTPALGWWSLGIALVAYALSVMHRSSFGVAGPQAESHFAVSATTLSVFVVVQLVVYSLGQIPVGIALDKYGVRALVTAGSLTMAGGQLALALTDSVALAIAARGFIGAGDACIFISVVRLVPAWFPPRRVPLLTQIVGVVGQCGQFLSAVPFLAILSGFGWQTAFISAAAVGAAVGVLTGTVVRNGPTGTVTPAKQDRLLARSTEDSSLKSVLAEPGSWLGFWSHWITGFTVKVALFMWGVPFLTHGHNLSTAQVSLVLSTNPAVAIVAALIIGKLSARYPMRRSLIVMASAIPSGVAWIVVLQVDEPLPLWALVAWMAVISSGTPASVVGFDYGRMFNHASRLGKATGFINTGAFCAAIASIFVIGLILDAVAPAGMADYTLADFRLAFSVMIIPWIIGLIGVLWCRRSARGVLATYGVHVIPAHQRISQIAKQRQQAGKGHEDRPSQD